MRAEDRVFPELPPRLSTLVRLVGQAAVAADIGTGDGLVPVALVLSGRAARVIASDTSAATLDVCRATLLRYGVSPDGGPVEIRRGNGLAVLRTCEAEVAILAGMGGLTIAGILSRGPLDVAGRYVLGPMSHAEELRVFLRENGFGLVDEAIVRQGHRFYEFEVVVPPVPYRTRAGCREEHPAGEFPLLAGGVIGPILWRRRDPVLREYILYLLGKLQDLEGRMPPREYRRKYARRAEDLRALLAKWDGT